MKLTVIGDSFLDCDTVGTADRMSPDGPVPVVDVTGRTFRPGGAGLAALLLSRAGHEVTLVTALGMDERAEQFRSLVHPVRVVSADAGRPTPVKQRVTADGAVVTRIDDDCVPAAGVGPDPTDTMTMAVGDADGLLVSDYGRGMVQNPRLRDVLGQAATVVPLVWDPHPRGAPPVAGTAAVTPNLSELRTLSPEPETVRPGDDVTVEAADAAARLLGHWHLGAAVVTLGSEGAVVVTTGGGDRPVVAVPVSTPVTGDTCGAGDCFAGSLLARLVAGCSLVESTRTAVESAASFLGYGGVGSLVTGGIADRAADGAGVTAPEIPVASPRRRCEEVRDRGGTVVATGGCFDLIHVGHVRTLTAARGMGDHLVVLLNSDESVRRLKGPTRPVMTQADRADLLRGLECVDDVVIFTGDDPSDALRELRPNIWVKGGDYVIGDLAEAPVVQSWGGEVVTVPFHAGRSTSGFIEKVERSWTG